MCMFAAQSKSNQSSFGFALLFALTECLLRRESICSQLSRFALFVASKLKRSAARALYVAHIYHCYTTHIYSPHRKSCTERDADLICYLDVQCSQRCWSKRHSCECTHTQWRQNCCETVMSSLCNTAEITWRFARQIVNSKQTATVIAQCTRTMHKLAF